MDEFEYSNGADGSCQECGEATDEEYHRLCADCFAEENGWARPAWRPDPDAIADQHEDRQQVTQLRIAGTAAVVHQELRLEELHARRVELLEQRDRVARASMSVTSAARDP